MHWLLIGLLVFDLAAIKTEPNLEHRSQLAMDNANAAFDMAKGAYNTGDFAKSQTAIEEVGASVDVAYESLQQSGKNPRNNKFFKRAEVGTRELLRKLEGMRLAVSSEDRQTVEKVRDRVSKVHDELLQDILGKKKK